MAVFLWSLLCNYGIILWQPQQQLKDIRFSCVWTYAERRAGSRSICPSGLHLSIHLFPFSFPPTFHLSVLSSICPLLPLTFFPSKPDDHAQAKASVQFTVLHRLYINSSWCQIIALVLSACHRWQSWGEKNAVMSVRSKSVELKGLLQVHLTPALGPSDWIGARVAWCLEKPIV